MNSRTLYNELRLEEGNFFRSHLTGAKFTYGNAAERKIAEQQIKDYSVPLLHRIEQSLGRELSQSEIRHGVQHRDTRTVQQRIDQEQKWKQIFAPKLEETDPNPYRRELKRIEEEQLRADPLYKLKKQADDWDRQQKKKADRQKMLANPRRQAAIKSAQAILSALKFSEKADESDYFEAEQRLRFVENGGSLSEFEKMTNEWKAEFSNRLRTRALPLIEKRSELEAEIQEVEKPLELPPPKITNICDEHGQILRQEIEE